MADRGSTLKASTILAMAAAALLPACGDDDGNPGPGPGNRAPTFTPAATASIQEGAAGAVYVASATDPDGDALTFSLAGGADQADFTITAGGNLSFVGTPDFEAPADADGNNVYLVQIAVSDGQTSATLDLSITVLDAGPDAFRVSRVGTGFNQPLALVPVPDNSGRVFVVERPGRIRILNPASGATTPFLDVVGQTTTDGERGLLGMASAPDFAATGTFYVFLTNTAGNIEIRRYGTVAGNRDQADPASADVILVIPHPGFPTTMAAGSSSGPTGCSTSAPATAAAAAIPTGTPRIEAACSARSCASTSPATISPATRHATTRSRAAIPSRVAAARPKSGLMACATRSVPASIRSPRICGSATSARARARRSI